MPHTSLIAQICAWISLFVLFATIIFTISLNGWKYDFLKYLILNTAYCIISGIIAYAFSVDSLVYKYFSNLTIPVHIITFLMVLYSLWKNEKFKRYLKISIIPVMATWLFTLMIGGIDKIHYINLLLPAVWISITSIIGFLLLYFSETEQKDLATKFIISAGFLFYSFNYVIIKTAYIIINNTNILNDAWNLNMGSWLISRVLILIAALYFLFNQKTNYRLKSNITW